ncbi:MAG: FkbM family methyltransferase [Planctomycetota bacterium]
MLTRLRKNLARIFRGRRPNEPDGFAAQRRLVESEAPAILDVGAYDGRSSIRYRQLFPAATIHAFEPADDSFAKLRAAAGPHRITAHHLALAGEEGEAELHLSEWAECHSLRSRPTEGQAYFPSHVPTVGVQPVRTTTLDRFCDEQGIDRVDILKLDVEGLEREVLQGGARLLEAGAIGLIYVELMFAAHYAGQALYLELAQALDSHGFALFSLHDLRTARDGRLRYGNGLFVKGR